MSESKSEIANLRLRIELEEEAAQRGLCGPAIVASHESIAARMERGAERILQLIEAGKHEEALALMNTEMWGVEESSESVCRAPIYRGLFLIYNGYGWILEMATSPFLALSACLFVWIDSVTTVVATYSPDSLLDHGL